ncbi:MAG: YccS family putative transporter [Psychromonas sp.]|nr:YccS family putative transporter [Psychromonas sp.]
MQTSNSMFIFRSTIRKLISDSNIHSGIRVLIAMAITFIPALKGDSLTFFGQNALHISISLCLGVMASAIVETDDNYKGRGKFIATILLCFFIASSSVELLMPYPIAFTLGLFTSCFAFMMLAVLGPHYTKIGFGAILIAIYTMIGYQADINWYVHPIFLSIGALWYGIFSIVWNFYAPYHSLREQLAQLYFAISRYQQQKSALFNEKNGSSREGFFSVRQQLAIQNIAITARLEQSKRIIQSRFKVCQNQDELNKLNNYYFIAEQIHERISASQYLYSQLDNTFRESQILEGFHQLLLQISDECYQLGGAINDKKKYQHSRRLKWTVNALSDQLHLLKQKQQLFNNQKEAMQALQAIYDNINGINNLLLDIAQNKQLKAPVIAIEKPEENSQPILKQLLTAMKATNPVFKHAVRISLGLSVAFILQHLMHLPQGFWLLLTVLFVCQPSFSETRKRLIQRSLGTLIGILIGYPIVMLVGGTIPQVFLFVFSAFLFFNYLRTNYGLAVVFITLFVIFLFNLLNGTGMEILGSRIGETLLGCILSMLTITFVLPDWQFQRFPKLVQQLLLFSERYLKQVIQQYQHGRNEDLDYRTTRFQTFKIDAALTSAWQSMLFEPSSKQKLTKEVYALVNRCDTLVSYIAALASHRHKIDDLKHNQELQNLMNEASKLIIEALNPHTPDNQNLANTVENIENIENNKAIFTGESLLIVEQLRLIAFTALDIQLLLKEANFYHTQSD